MSFIRQWSTSKMPQTPSSNSNPKTMISWKILGVQMSLVMNRVLWLKIYGTMHPELRHIVVLGEGAEPTEEKPPAPSDDPQDDPDYSAWGPKPSTVTYHQLIPYLVKSIQELETRIKVLEGG